MECNECNYPLWNLTTRTCPECGKEFLPSEYEFVKNSVQFCCPQCNQPYYGTAENGHLEPQNFTCVKCGQPLEMDACVLRPTAGVRDEQTRPDEMPWLERKQTGKTIRAFFKTIGMSISAPSRLLRVIANQKPAPGQALWFLALLIIVSLLSTSVTLVALFTISAGFGGGGPPGMGGFFMLTPIIILMVLIFLWHLIWIMGTHVILFLGGSKKGGMGYTAEALSYAAGPYLITAIPCLGFYLIPVAAIWGAITAIFTLKERQEISGGRAALAVLPTLVLAVLLIAGSVTAMFVGIFNTLNTFRNTQGNPQRVEFIGEQLQSMTMMNNDIFPQHAVEIFSPELSQSPRGMVSALFSELRTDQIPVGSGTLADITDPPINIDKANRIIQEAIDALPQNVIAHRLGAIVYTYHGIDSTDLAQDELWRLIGKFTETSPAAGAAALHDPNWIPATEVYVFDASGFMLTIPLKDFAANLAGQNKLRHRFNLPPLPDPDAVTYEQPAAGDFQIGDQ